MQQASYSTVSNADSAQAAQASSDVHPLQQLMTRLNVSEDMTPSQILQQAVEIQKRMPAPVDPYIDEGEAYFYGAPFSGGSAWGDNVVGNAPQSTAGRLASEPSNTPWQESNVVPSGQMTLARSNDPKSPKQKPCPFFAQGMCKYGSGCRYSHDSASVQAGAPPPLSMMDYVANFDPVSAAATAQQNSDICTICLESPVDAFRRYGILPACDHVFCLPCIRAWRATHGMARGKDCPICRKKSYFVIPSFRFVRSGPAKDMLMHSYHQALKQIPCKNFLEGKCPFGSSCFYKHVDKEGNEVAPEEVKVLVGVDGFAKPAPKFSLADYIKR